MADYTCVAVNAGGVMEENISLTFEEPEPVRKAVQNSSSFRANEVYFILHRCCFLLIFINNCP